MQTLARWLVLIAFAATIIAPGSAVAAPGPGDGRVSPDAFLNPDGSLNLPEDFNGSFDLEGWEVSLDAEKGPIFLRADNQQSNSSLALQNETETPTETLAASDTPSITETPIPSETPSETLGPIDTATPSYAVEVADTSTETPTPSETLPASDTPSPTETLPESDTPTFTFTASPTASPTTTPTPTAKALSALSSGFVEAAAVEGQWTSLGGSGSGLNGAVYSIEVEGGVIYAGGEFTDAGGDLNADHIAKWNGTNWSSLGGANTGLNFAVWEILIDGGVLYAAGDFVDAGGDGNADHIAKFTGGAWQSLGGANSGLNNWVVPLAIHNGEVYAGGGFTNAGGDANADYIAKFSGGSWHPVHTSGNPLSNTVSEIQINNDTVYIGGWFQWIPDYIHYIAKIPVTDGSYSAFGPGDWAGLNSVVYDIEIDGYLYAAGDFSDVYGSSGQIQRVARWTGASWDYLGSGLNAQVLDIEIYNSIAYAGGNFANAGGDANGDGIAKYTSPGSNNLEWTSLNGAGSGLNAAVREIEIVDGVLYAGGWFVNAGGDANANYIAQFGLSAATSTPTNTYTPSITNTASNTPTNTRTATPSNTPTPSDSPTASETPTPSDTPTPSNTPTTSSTPTSSSTPTPGPSPTPTNTNIPAIEGQWSALGGGLNGRVFGIDASGLYAGGFFTDAGADTNADRIAQFSGVWASLGGANTGLNGTVRDVIYTGGIVYAAGEFTDAGGNINADYVAMFSGGAWTPLGTGLNAPVYDIAYENGVLYAGGEFTDAGGDANADKIAQYSAGAWSSLGGAESGLSSYVTTINFDGGAIYAGGAFINAGGDANADYIAKFSSGVWSSLGGAGTGLSTIVDVIEFNGGVLYAGGGFTDAGGDVNADLIAKFSAGTWSSLGGANTGLSGSNVFAIKFRDGVLYAGGAFTDAGGNVNADHIAQYSSGIWSALASGLSSYVDDIQISGANLYAGGNFTDAGGDANGDYIAQFGLPSPTATPTSTATNTFIPSNTPTPSDTPTNTFTPSSTLTPSVTLSPTWTTVPSINGQWSALGGVNSGLNNAVNVIAFDDDVLYAGGYFTNAGGDPDADFIAKFTGGVWSSLGGTGSGLNGAVEDIQILDGAIYAGGWFTNAGGDPDADYIARFYNGDWSALGVAGSLNASVLDLYVVWNGPIYAGGNFTNAGGDPDADYIAVSEFNFVWTSLGGTGTGLNGGVTSIEFDSGILYAGGAFTNAGADADADYIAKYDFNANDWSSLGGVGSGLSSTVFDILIGSFYAGGGFTDAGGNANGDRIAEFVGGAWSPLGGGLNSTVSEIREDSGVVYAGGGFANAGGDGDADYIAQFYGGAWHSLNGFGSGLNNVVYAIQIHDGVLYAGGGFTNAGGDSNADMIAKIGGVPISSPTPTTTMTPTATSTPSKTPTPTNTPSITPTFTPSHTPTITGIPPVPAKPTLVSPRSGSLITDYTPRLDWRNASGAHHYEIQIALDFAFTNVFVEETNVLTSEFTPVSDLATNSRFYWRVRTFNFAGQSSAWSSIWSFRTALLTPVLDAPANNETLLNRQPAFSWFAVPGARSYMLQVSQHSNFSSMVINIRTTQLSYTRRTDLAANTRLFWRVRAYGANGPSLWSIVRRLKTANPPSIPRLLFPANGAWITDTTPRLDWSESSLPIGTTFDHYQLQVATDNTFTNIVLNYSEPNRLFSEYTFTSELITSTTYFWRVRSYNTLGQYSGWGYAQNFHLE